MKKKIAIIGAGVAGLTLANLIKSHSNFEFIIYEKKETLTAEDGFGIQLATNSVSILNKIGFKKINAAEIYHPNNLDFYSFDSKKICNLNLSQFNSEEIKYTTLQRSTLINFLKNQIYTQHLKFGKNIQKVSEIKEKILINFDDNTKDEVDYVVAADGIFSNTRKFFEANINKPKYKNAIAVRTIIESNSFLDIDEKNINILMGSNAHIVIYPVNKKNELNLVCVIRMKNSDQDNVKNIIKKKFLNYNPNLKNLFQNDLKSWPLYATSKIIPSSNKKVFYIGDAFYTFLPSMAQGASQSIEGAFELFDILSKNSVNAHNLYFEKRSKRVKQIKKRSDFNFFAFHISIPIISRIRNLILKSLVKSKSFVSRYLGEVYKH
jgi:salicylate hydroxylase